MLRGHMTTMKTWRVSAIVKDTDRRIACMARINGQTMTPCAYNAKMASPRWNGRCKYTGHVVSATP